MTYLDRKAKEKKNKEEYRTQRKRECEGGKEPGFVLLLLFCASDAVIGEKKEEKRMTRTCFQCYQGKLAVLCSGSENSEMVPQPSCRAGTPMEDVESNWELV